MLASTLGVAGVATAGAAGLLEAALLAVGGVLTAQPNNTAHAAGMIKFFLNDRFIVNFLVWQ